MLNLYLRPRSIVFVVLPSYTSWENACPLSDANYKKLDLSQRWKWNH